MEVTGGQEFAFAGRQPALACLGLALGAVPVLHELYQIAVITAARASIAMTAHRSPAAAQTRAKRFELLKADKVRIDTDPESVSPCARRMSATSEGGPSHFCFFV